MWLGREGPFCDGCFDERISAATGWPRLPVPPNPMVVPDPEGRARRFRVRLSRSPGGISAEAFEDRPGSDNDDGYRLSVFGEHDADPGQLLAQLERRVRAEVGHRYLEHDQGRWHVAEQEIAGRVDYSEAGPPDVVVDGRRLSWDELGHMVASFRGLVVSSPVRRRPARPAGEEWHCGRHTAATAASVTPLPMMHRAAGPAGSPSNWSASAASLGDRLQGQLTGEDRGGGEVA